jgi:hypothetical protein
LEAISIADSSTNVSIGKVLLSSSSLVSDSAVSTSSVVARSRLWFLELDRGTKQTGWASLEMALALDFWTRRAKGEGFGSLAETALLSLPEGGSDVAEASESD